MTTKSNPKSDSTDVPQAATTDFPDDVKAMITDLLTRQQNWQKQQSKSEELIARMADQLEQSQRVIQSLAAGETPGKDSATTPTTRHGVAKAAEPKAAAKSTADNSAMSWENQKALFMNGHSPEAPAAPESDVVSFMTKLIPPVQKLPALEVPDDEDNAPVCPKGLSLEARIEHEMDLLEDCEPADRIRWLKARLEDRLRESEIEISIERARIGREKRELERMRSAFEEEVARMREEDTSSSKRSRKDNKDRWSRFLGR